MYERARGRKPNGSEAELKAPASLGVPLIYCTFR